MQFAQAEKMQSRNLDLLARPQDSTTATLPSPKFFRSLNLKMAQAEPDVHAGDAFVGIDDDEEKARAITENDLHIEAWYFCGSASKLQASSTPSWQDLVGALSIIIWSLTLIVTVKYCFIVLSADDDGQGGTFALYSLLARYTNISRRDPRDVPGIRLQRFETGDLKTGGKSLRSLLEKSRTIQFFLQFIGVLGVSMVMADGVLTPAQSVLGAIQGIKVINSNLGTSAIVGISCGIFVAFFLIQPFGTSKIGTMFAPIVVIWLLFNLCAGVYNLAVHDYAVLKAFSPHFAFSYLVRNRHEGWKSLGGNAYGVCVITVTFITTCMVSLVAILVWRLPAYIVIPFWLIFASLDAAFLSSVYEKIPDGVWFTFILAFILSCLFTLRRFGKECQWEAESHDQLSPQALLCPTTAAKGPVALSSTFGGTPISTVPGLGIFFDKSGIANTLPPSFFQFVIKFAARPAVVVLFNMRPLPVPTVPLTDRYIIRRVSEMDSCYAVTLRHGYTDSILYPGLAQDVVQQIAISIAKGRRNDMTAVELDLVQSLPNYPTVYILGKETIKIGWPSVLSPKAHLRSWLLWVFLWLRENSRTKLADLDIDAEKVIEVGFIKEL
ncbi:potassium uptake [Fusarium phyllophilum]|uniref:Potassium uptake n=1 Tax=Fusarium phyllophilum TaxID=47803 RepID=A0A8H5IL41_9HYPO|nr:potassium uptake [Fusarium phyllophilum]